MYFDGVEYNLNTSALSDDASRKFIIGGINSVDNYFNGHIDEVARWESSAGILNSTEILDLYRLQESKYFCKVNLSDFASNSNESETREFYIDETDPIISNVLINETSVYNDKNIKVNATVTDNVQLQTIYVAENSTGSWVNQSTTQSGSEFYYEIPKANLQNQENVSYYVIANDTSNNLVQSTVTSFFVLNRAPNNTTLTSPTNASSSTDRTPTFSWNTIQDPDNKTGNVDLVTYLMQVDKQSNSDIINPTAPDFSEPDINISTVSSSFTITPELDVDTIYYWRVRVNDSYNNQSNFSSVFQLNITSEININLDVNSVTFGTLNPGDEDDTLDDSPKPFNFTNDGNAFVNVSINASGDLWTTQPGSTQYFQFKTNETVETSSFNTGLSQFNAWANIPPQAPPTFGVAYLNHSNATDSAEIEIRIQAPLGEPPGAKTTTAYMIAELARRNL